MTKCTKIFVTLFINISLFFSISHAAETGSLSNNKLSVPKAPEHPIEFTGDFLSLDQTLKRIEASGNIVASTNHYIFYGNRLHYNLDSQSLLIPDSFHINFLGFNCTASSLNYTLPSKNGSAKSLEAIVKQFNIKGEHVDLFPDRIEIKNAFFKKMTMILKFI